MLCHGGKRSSLVSCRPLYQRIGVHRYLFCLLGRGVGSLARVYVFFLLPTERAYVLPLLNYDPQVYGATDVDDDGQADNNVTKAMSDFNFH